MSENLPEVISPRQQIAAAGDAAGACKQIVSSTALKIQGRSYVRVEGWQAIAIAHGCVASARDVERIDGGVRAIGEVRRMDTGNVIATAEGFVGDDEAMWQKRPEYARRAMAQTRAISRVCRSAFAHVVVMMAAGLETTPAEEVGDEHAAVRTERGGEQQTERRELGGAPPQNDGSTISENQAKRFFAIAKKRADFADTKQWLIDFYPYTHGNSRSISRSDYDAICTRMEDPRPLLEPDPPPDSFDEAEVGELG